MLLPDEDRYTERHYLRDAFNAWRRYWSRDLHSYFDGSLTKHPGVSTWDEWKPVVWFFVYAAGFLGICWLIANHQHYQIMPYHGPLKLTPFTTTTTGP